jgi:hypothetical protein
MFINEKVSAAMQITNNPLVARSKSYQFIVKSIAAPNPPYEI